MEGLLMTKASINPTSIRFMPDGNTEVLRIEPLGSILWNGR
jgi:hypothetical protein